MDDPDVVAKQVRIDAPPEIVFEYFTDPEKLMRWKGVEAKLDPVAGGIYRVDMNGRDVIRGEYVEVAPPHRLVFTWGWEAVGNPVPPGSSTVEITLERDGDSTIVRLVHRDLPVPARAVHDEGWTHYLPRLALAAADGDPGPDPWAR